MASTDVAAPRTPTRTGFEGEVVAFTGRLATMTRRHAHRRVVEGQGEVCDEVCERTTMLVVGMDGWPLADTGKLTKKLQDAERLRASGSSIIICTEYHFRERAGLEPCESGMEKHLRADQVASALGVTTEKILRWERAGLVRGHDGKYDFRDMVSLKTIAELVERGVKPLRIRRSLAGLLGVLPGVDRPLLQLRLLDDDDGNLCADMGDNLVVAPDGQLHMRFDDKGDQGGGPPTPLRLTAETVSVDDLLDAGCDAERHGDFVVAEDYYRRAIDIAPTDARGQFNLGNALAGQGRIDAAGERFAQAAALDPANPASWYNLAVSQEHLGRMEEARASLRRACQADPQYADAWFNLAYLSEEAGAIEDARTQWATYLRLDQTSEWAVEARRRLNALKQGA